MQTFRGPSTCFPTLLLLGGNRTPTGGLGLRNSHGAEEGWGLWLAGNELGPQSCTHNALILWPAKHFLYPDFNILSDKAILHAPQFCLLSLLEYSSLSYSSSSSCPSTFSFINRLDRSCSCSAKLRSGVSPFIHQPLIQQYFLKPSPVQQDDDYYGEHGLYLWGTILRSRHKMATRIKITIIDWFVSIARYNTRCFTDTLPLYTWVSGKY